MQQVLFHIPVLPGFFGPEGIPIHGFGAMLFVTFVACMNFAVRRGRSAGIAGERIQDMCLVLLVSGIFGARTFYMVQYDRPIAEFFAIWEGGIVFYGSILGGVLGYTAFYYWVLKPLKISTWVLADVVAPSLALGLMLGRIGCLLNGCCYGQVACTECAALEFPLLTGPARSTVVHNAGYQTALGFSADDRWQAGDPRTVVKQVEPDSQALAAGLQPGDRIVAVDGVPNGLVLTLAGSAETFERVRVQMEKFGPLTVGEKPVGTAFGRASLAVAEPSLFLLAKEELGKVAGAQVLGSSDWLNYQLQAWPKGHSKVRLTVERAGGRIDLPPFTPRTLGLQPTQVYESVSMGLMVLVLLSFYPLRKYDGQVMVLLMFGYSVHRFLNEMLRNDTDPVIRLGGVRLTASMTVSLLVFAAAVGLHLYLRRSRAVPNPIPVPAPAPA